VPRLAQTARTEGSAADSLTVAGWWWCSKGPLDEMPCRHYPLDSRERWVTRAVS